jgi:hypothetical protein
LKYENLKSDPLQAVTKLAEFLGLPFTGEKESSGVPQDVVKLCSFEMLTSLQVNQVDAVLQGNKVQFSIVILKRGKNIAFILIYSTRKHGGPRPSKKKK